MSLTDLAFKEHFSFKEVQEIIADVGKPCDINWAYKQLNKYHFHFDMLIPNKDKIIKTWLKELKSRAEYQKKHIEKMSHCLDFLKKSENNLINEGIQPNHFLATIKTIEYSLEKSKCGYESLLLKPTKLQNMKVSSYVVGGLIPELYQSIYNTKFTYTNDCIGYDDTWEDPSGYAIRFTEKIINKYGIKYSLKSIPNIYRRVLEAQS